MDGHHFPFLQPDLGPAHRGRVGRAGNRLLIGQQPPVDRLHNQQQGHHLGNRGNRQLFVRVLFKQHLPAGQFNQDGGFPAHLQRGRFGGHRAVRRGPRRDLLAGGLRLRLPRFRVDDDRRRALRPGRQPPCRQRQRGAKQAGQPSFSPFQAHAFSPFPCVGSICLVPIYAGGGGFMAGDAKSGGRRENVKAGRPFFALRAPKQKGRLTAAFQRSMT